MKKIKLFAAAVIVLCLALAISACGEKIPAEMTYKVTVMDALGTPYTKGVVVRFCKTESRKPCRW